MNKLIIACTIGLLFINRGQAQTADRTPIAIGTTMVIFGTGMMAGYVLENQHGFSHFHSNEGPITAADKKQIRRDNLPWLLTGSACYLIAIVSYCEAAHVEIHFKKSKVTAGIMGAGVGLSYAIK